MTSVYAQRRERLVASLMAQGHLGPCLIWVPGHSPVRRNRDNLYPFRPDSDFYYLTGFAEPQSALVIWVDASASFQTHFFCQPKDPQHAIWEGVRLGVDEAPTTLGVDHAYDVAAIDEVMPRLLRGIQTVVYPWSMPAGEGTELRSQLRWARWQEVLRQQSRLGLGFPTHSVDLAVYLDPLRQLKDIHEQGLMRRAAAISAQGHVRAMQVCHQRMAAGLTTCEYHLAAELSHVFSGEGAQALAYDSIVASGPNACVLHHRASQRVIQAGELVLIDAACELDNYASDITRTFPSHGRFTSDQQAIYELVLGAHAAAVAAVKPGVSWQAPHQAALQVLAQGLLDIGLLSRETWPDAQAVLEAQAYKPFFMHRTSHWLGLDVHDCGSYAPDLLLAPGMVLTVEPGLYIRPDAAVPERFHHLGVRIEDDILVTQDAHEVLSRAVPVEVKDIEALMRA
jgi:Xaa-Pro aminopeptidase